MTSATGTSTATVGREGKTVHRRDPPVVLRTPTSATSSNWGPELTVTAYSGGDNRFAHAEIGQLLSICDRDGAGLDYFVPQAVVEPLSVE